MALYALKSLSTQEIINIFEWDGISELNAPSGFEIVAYVDGELQVSSNIENQQYGGDFFGTFEGSIKGVLSGTVTNALKSLSSQKMGFEYRFAPCENCETIQENISGSNYYFDEYDENVYPGDGLILTNFRDSNVDSIYSWVSYLRPVRDVEYKISISQYTSDTPDEFKNDKFTIVDDLFVLNLTSNTIRGTITLSQG
jgi:hypothetical protein